MKRVALLTKYGGLAASTRQRFLQYRPYFEANGLTFEEHPLFDDEYLERLYLNGKRGARHVGSRYFRRLTWLLRRGDFEVIWLHCELFPYLPGIFERLVRRPSRPIVFDFDDAIFHNYDLHPNAVVRGLLSNKLRTTIAAADVTLAGNAYLAEYSRLSCSHVEVVPTVVNIDQYVPSSTKRLSEEIRIGWIGTPSTWSQFMVPMLPLLSRIAGDRAARISAVGASGTDVQCVDVIPWSEETEISSIQGMDIGVMPLTDTPWARGKCGYKLIQYMACGLPVVASPVGVNAEIVDHGVNGFLASSEAEWQSALETLINDPELRLRMGQAGRKRVERDYSLQVHGPRVARLFADVAGRSV